MANPYPQSIIIMPTGPIAYKRAGGLLTVWVGDKVADAPEDATIVQPAVGCTAWSIIGMPQAVFATEFTPELHQLSETYSLG